MKNKSPQQIMESKQTILKCKSEEIAAIRKEFNIHNEDDREKAFRIIEEWLLKQDHLVKKKYSRNYLENCIITSKGSIKAAELQIDKICTLRTLHPIYFKYTNVFDQDLDVLNKSYIGLVPKLTKDHCRVIIAKTKPNISVQATDFERFHAFLVMLIEFLKANDYYKGFYFIVDGQASNLSDILPRLNLVELQQFLTIFTGGLGCRIKRIIFLTKSKFLEKFVKLIKPLFKEKIRNRIHIATKTYNLKDYMNVEILPKEYGGIEKPIEELHDDLFRKLSSEPVKNLLAEMHAARTDETKRQQDVFNDQYMGMSGTFRTISLD